MELKIVRAYISALFDMAKTGQTFSTEANALIRELAEPQAKVIEIFEPIHRAPANSFESALKFNATRKATQ